MHKVITITYLLQREMTLKWKEHKNKCEGMTKLNHQKLQQYIFQIQINCVDLFVCAHHNWEYSPVLFMCTNNSCKTKTKLNPNPNLHVCSTAVTSFTGSHLHLVLQWQTTNAFIRTLIHLSQYFCSASYSNFMCLKKLILENGFHLLGGTILQSYILEICLKNILSCWWDRTESSNKIWLKCYIN